MFELSLTFIMINNDNSRTVLSLGIIFHISYSKADFLAKRLQYVRVSVQTMKSEFRIHIKYVMYEYAQ